MVGTLVLEQTYGSGEDRLREVGIEVRALVRSSSATSSVSVHDSSTPDGSHLVMVMVRVRIRVKAGVRVRVRVGLGLGLGG